MKGTVHKKDHNRILQSLKKSELAQIMPKLERISLTLKDVLFENDKPIEHVYFPLGGVHSLVVEMKDGSYSEVGTVGNEGIVGMPVFFGATKSPIKCFCQVPGEVLRMSAKDFRAELNNGTSLNVVVHRYAQGLMNQIAQSTACNSLHSTEQRMARWLLMTHDRVGVDEFPLTQEFLAQMLGVRRASVTVCAGILHKGGMIDYVRGRIHIIDRALLEQAACECYDIVRKEYERLLA